MQHDGIIGPSPFLLHEPFHPVSGYPVDYMHSVLLGVTKQLLDLWLSTESKDKDYYIGNKVLSNAREKFTKGVLASRIHELHSLYFLGSRDL